MWSFLTIRPKAVGIVLDAGTSIREMRHQVTSLIGKGHNSEALEVVAHLQAIEEHEPRWPHKRGDLLRASGRTGEAANAYFEAADRYERQGFPKRASAMRAVAERLDPSHSAAQAAASSLHPALLSHSPC